MQFTKILRFHVEFKILEKHFTAMLRRIKRLLDVFSLFQLTTAKEDSSILSQHFFNCYLAALWPTLGHC